MRGYAKGSGLAVLDDEGLSVQIDAVEVLLRLLLAEQTVAIVVAPSSGCLVRQCRTRPEAARLGTLFLYPFRARNHHR
jgi:hypothetical protein